VNSLFSRAPPAGFDSDIDEETSSYHLNRCNSKKHSHTSLITGSGRKQHRVKYEIFELEDKLSGEMVEFNRYNDWDLPFLNDPKNESCNMMRRNII